VSNLPQALG
jgi:hypothetical protein